MSTFTVGGLTFGPEVYGLAAILGLICGSFVTALSHRLPRGEDFVSGRSRCPICQNALTPRDLVPVFSWLLSVGRCRHCSTKISARYPLTELICAALFVAVIWVGQGDGLLRLCLMWLLTICLLSLAIVDFEAQKLPNGLVLFVFALCSGLAWVDGRSVLEAGVMAASATLIAMALRWLGRVLSGQNGLGWGDVKLAAAVAVALKPDDLPLFLAVLGAFALALAAITAVRLGWAQAKTGIPFGPALCAGAFAVLI